jgi:hypothetical protein
MQLALLTKKELMMMWKINVWKYSVYRSLSFGEGEGG